MATGVAAGIRSRLKGMRAPRLRTVFGQGRLLGLVLLVGLVILRALDPAPLQMLRVKTFDLYQNIKPRQIKQRPVTIIDIDEKSLKEIGQWPWPRTILAELVTRLTAMGAVVIAFDVVFAEPDRTSPSSVAEILPGVDESLRKRLERLPSNDEVLAAAIRRSRVVMGQSVRNIEGYKHPDDIPKTSVGHIGPDPRLWVERHSGMIRNVPILDKAATGRGIFNVSGELDGIVRRVPMLVDVAGTLYPSLSAEMLRVATGNKTIVVKSQAQTGIDGIIVRPNLIKTDQRGRVWVYFAHHDKEKYVSAADVLNGTAPPEKIAGRLLILGTSAVGLLDIKSSPVDSFLPGVEVHAQILENIISGEQLQRPRHADGAEVVLTALAGLLMIILVPLIGARYTILLLLLAVGAAGATSWWYFDTHRLLYSPVYPALSAIALYMLLTYSNYAREEAQRRQVRDAFSRYMSPALVERSPRIPAS